MLTQESRVRRDWMLAQQSRVLERLDVGSGKYGTGESGCWLSKVGYWRDWMLAQQSRVLKILDVGSGK